MSGRITYTPAPGCHGIDSFTYTVTDFAGGTATGTVMVTVRPVNVPPPPPAARAVVASLVTRKHKGKKTLFVRVVYADTGALKAEARSPFQSPAFKAVRAVAVDTDGDGVPEAVRVSARKGKKTFTTTLAV